jgi:hypothetical protein
MKTKLITVLAAFSCLALTNGLRAQTLSGGQRSDPRNGSVNTCTLFADSVPVWLWIFEESEEHGDGAWMTFAGKLERGQKRVITSGTDRIRYSYKTTEHEEMHDDIGAWCYRGNTIRVP